MRISFALLLAACATTTTSTPKGGPRGLRATEHLDSASQHETAARDDRSWTGDATPSRDTAAVPWMTSWNPAGEHERLATLHRSKAAALQAAYEEACGSRPLAEVSVSPLVRYARSGWNTSTGVILYLAAEAGPADKLLAEIKCHRAWMMLAPSNMDDCPLDLPGIALDARGDDGGVTVSIVTKDPKYVEELQRRANMDLEKSAQLRTKE